MSVSGLDSSRERHFIKVIRVGRTGHAYKEKGGWAGFVSPRAARAALPVANNIIPSASFIYWQLAAGNRQLHSLYSRQLHPRHSASETGLAHLLEHLFHLRVLAEQVIYFLHSGAGAAGDAFAPAAVDHFVMIALVHRHRIDNGLDAVDLFFVHAVGGFLQAGERTDAGQHSHQALDRAHLLYLPQLVAKVFEREAVAGEGFGGHLLRLLLVDLRFGALDQRKNVAHAENARHDAVGMKRLQRIVLLAHADEFDGLPRHLPDGKRRAAASIAVHLGKDDAGERELLVELVGGAHRVLPGHGVGDEQNL